MGYRLKNLLILKPEDLRRGLEEEIGDRIYEEKKQEIVNSYTEFYRETLDILGKEIQKLSVGGSPELDIEDIEEYVGEYKRWVGTETYRPKGPKKEELAKATSKIVDTSFDKTLELLMEVDEFKSLEEKIEHQLEIVRKFRETRKNPRVKVGIVSPFSGIKRKSKEKAKKQIESRTCPECGKEFGSEKGVKIHKSRVH